MKLAALPRFFLLSLVTIILFGNGLFAQTVTTVKELADALDAANGSANVTTITLAAGTYTLTADLPILAANRLTLKGPASGAPAILDAKNLASGVSLDVAASQVTIANLVFQNARNHTILIHPHADQGTIKDCTFASTVALALTSAAIDGYGCANWTVTGNTLSGIVGTIATAEPAIHFYGGASGTTITNNFILNCDRAVGLGTEPHTPYSTKPGSTNTGVPAGTQLTPSGSITVNTAGAVIHDLDIVGSITVLADRVTIRRVRITSGDYYPIRYFDNNNTGLIVEDSEIVGNAPGTVTCAIGFTNYIARRLNIHGSADGLKADEKVLIESCWIHDLSNGPSEHNDGVQTTGGKNTTIRFCNIAGASNACVQGGDEGAAIENLVIDQNWLNGGGWTLNLRGSGATVPRNTRVTHNRFGHDADYGPITTDDPNPVITGNVYDDTGAPAG